MSGNRTRHQRFLAVFFLAILAASPVFAAPPGDVPEAIHGIPLAEARARAVFSELTFSNLDATSTPDPRLVELGQALQQHLTTQGQAGGGIQPPRKARSLKRSTSEVDLRLRPDSGTVRQLRIRPLARQRGVVLHRADAGVPPGRERDESTARDFLTANRSLLRLARPADELRIKGYDMDRLGFRHIRYGQYHQGIAVWPAELNVHLDANGDVYLLNGAYAATPGKMVLEPVITADQAAETARQRVAAAAPATVGRPELIVHAPGDRKNRLAWKIGVTVSPVVDQLVIVDAMTGLILDIHDLVMTANVRGSGLDLHGATRSIDVWNNGQGTYFLIDTSKEMYDPASQPPDLGKIRGGYVILDARNQPPTSNPTTIPDDSLSHITSTSPNGAWLADGVSLSSHLSSIYDYYRNVHDFQSHDGQGGTLTAIVRWGQGVQNAAMSGAHNFMVYGDGDLYAGALDVVAHEFQHGVTTYTANLVYKDQPGALNEAFSDIFGEMAEAYVRGANDWVIGTDLRRGGMRSLSDPASLEIQPGMVYPDRMSGYINTTQDNGGVHLNNTIVTHAYYLLAEGLAGSIGRADAEKIFFRALRYHLVNNSQFIDARLACVSATQELWANDPARRDQVIAVIEQAFDRVEIIASQATPTPGERPPVRGDDAEVFLYNNSYWGGTYLARCENGGCEDLSWDAASLSKPSVSGDGSLALFVLADNDLCFVPTDASTWEDCLDMPGTVHSVAISPDIRHWAFVFIDPQTGLADNTISVLDLTAGLEVERVRTFELVAPVMDGIATSSIVMADALDFSGDNRFLFYDAFNELRMADGTRQGVWSIYAIDLVTGQTLTVVPPVPGYDIGFPATGQASDTFLTFDAYDVENDLSIVMALNMINGDLKAVAAVHGGFGGVPCYLGDDSGIVYTASGSLWMQGLEPDRITPTGDDPLLDVTGGFYGVIYRRGAYTAPAADLELSATQLTYGQVAVGQSAGLPLTLTNTGTADLSVKSFSLTGAASGEFHVAPGGCQGQTLVPSGSCDVTVFFEPATVATRTATLVIEYQQPETTQRQLPLSGAGLAPAQHIITATAGPNGIITPSGSVSVVHGASQTFTMTPAPGYHVAEVLVDTIAIGQVTSHTFTDVTEDRAIQVTFAANLAKRSGDVNQDGAITLADAILALRLAGGDSMAGTGLTNGDVDNDGRIGLPEALYVLRTILARNATQTGN